MDIVERIKYYYQKGIYQNLHIQVFVEKQVITNSQFEEITGIQYTEVD